MMSPALRQESHEDDRRVMMAEVYDLLGIIAMQPEPLHQCMLV